MHLVVLGAVNLAHSALAATRNTSADENELAAEVNVMIKSSSYKD